MIRLLRRRRRPSWLFVWSAALVISVLVIGVMLVITNMISFSQMIAAGWEVLLALAVHVFAKTLGFPVPPTRRMPGS